MTIQGLINRVFGALLLPVLAACSNEASPSRVVITEPLTIPELDRERLLRIYLPPGYEDGTERYPVIYFHDGQNLFDAETAYAGEWGVDETLDAIHASTGQGFIAVGVDNGEELRMSEMAPWQHQDYGHAEADAYLDFIVDTVKPFVDERYRTLDSREHTAMLGSSMGGLVTHYAAFRHADTFSRVGLFSPSYWWSESIYSLGEDGCPDTRFFLLVGGKEDPVMVDVAERMHETLNESGCAVTQLTVVEGGEHNEALWRGALEEAVTWLYAPGTDAGKTVKDHRESIAPAN